MNKTNAVIEAKLEFLNYGLSKVWTVYVDGKQTDCWSAVSSKAAIKRWKAGMTTTTLKVNQAVTIIRENLATTLLAHIPNFCQWNAGKVTHIIGNRALVRWNKKDSGWFDIDALKAAN
jgi:hypothetical protein